MKEGDNALGTDLDKAMQLAANAFFSQTGHVGLSVALIENGFTHFYNYGVTSPLRTWRITFRGNWPNATRSCESLTS